jgi:uncharacterized protein YerC
MAAPPIIHGSIPMATPLSIFNIIEKIVQQKPLTGYSFCVTVISGEASMANVLSTDKKIAVIAALAEGSTIRSIERITGIHRDTIMRLGAALSSLAAVGAFIAQEFRTNAATEA